MPTITRNPSTSDAYLRGTGSSAFSTVRNQATGTVTGAAANDLIAQVDTSSGSGPWTFDRPLLAFDTSAIPDDATADSATLAIYVSGGSAPGGLDIYLDLVTAAPADPTSIASGDYDSFGTTRLTASSLNVYPASGQTYTFTLNAAGLAAINKSGYTSFFIVMANDFNNSPTSPSDLTAFLFPTRYYTYAQFNSGNAASNKPLLTVNYTISGGSSYRRRRPPGLYTR